MILCNNFFTLLKKYLNDNFILLFYSDPNQIKWRVKKWVDGSFLSPISFWKTVNFSIDPISETRWSKNNKLSSGVWQQITIKLNKLNYDVVMPKFSLCKHDGNDDSKMNFELRRDETLETFLFCDDIFQIKMIN